MQKKQQVDTEQVKTIQQLRCHRCGVELTEENSREVSSAFSMTGISHLCLDCEQKYFDQLKEKAGKHLALFYCCLAFNVPCKPLVIDGSGWETAKEGWIFYVDKLAETGEDRDGDKVLSFFDGVDDIFSIFGSKMSRADFSAHVMYERRRAESLPGTPEQRKKWGMGKEYTDEMYNELDRLYNARASSYVGQTITPQMEDTLIKTAKWNYKIDKLVDKGAFKAAKDLQSMVDSVLSAEQMRKKDEKPVEAYSVDTQTVMLERAGVMEKGKFLNLEGVQKALLANFLHAPKYDYSVDAVDQMLACAYKTMRANADLFVPTDMPDTLEVEDEYGEFEEEETEQERENKRFAGLTKITYEGDKHNSEKEEGEADEDNTESGETGTGQAKK